MENKDVQIGMRVVPHAKSEGKGYSRHLERAREWHQPYLYVTGKVSEREWGKHYDDDVWELSTFLHDSGADFFKAADFEPYVEEKK